MSAWVLLAGLISAVGSAGVEWWLVSRRRRRDLDADAVEDALMTTALEMQWIIRQGDDAEKDVEAGTGVPTKVQAELIHQRDEIQRDPTSWLLEQAHLYTVTARRLRQQNRWSRRLWGWLTRRP